MSNKTRIRLMSPSLSHSTVDSRGHLRCVSFACSVSQLFPFHLIVWGGFVVNFVIKHFTALVSHILHKEFNYVIILF